MVFYRVLDAFRGEPKLPHGPTRLPSYFPVEPKGCETQAQKLFGCLAGEATDRARDLEKAGFYESYFPDVHPPVVDPEIVKKTKEDPSLPQPGDNPLDACRSQIAFYQRCCDRELRKRKNWMLTEPYRVQEEYRYEGNTSGGSGT